MWYSGVILGHWPGHWAKRVTGVNMRNGMMVGAFFAMQVSVVQAAIPPVLLSPASNITIANPNLALSADLNGDRKKDLVALNADNGSISVLLGDGNGAFQNFAVSPNVTSAASAVLEDFNGDVKIDLAVAVNSRVQVFLGNGDGTFQGALETQIGSGATSIATGDFNRDRLPDLAVLTPSTKGFAILLGNGNGTFLPAVNHSVSTTTVYAVVPGDWNRDGIEDLATTAYGSKVILSLGNGDGTFRPGSSVPSGSGTPYGIVKGDFNLDGKLDLALSKFQPNAVLILTGNGDGTFRTGSQIGISGDDYRIVAADLNVDGRTDLAVPVYSTNTVSVFLSNGNGSFQPATQFAVGSGPFGVLAADFNGDRKPDLVSANYGGGSLSVLLNISPYNWPVRIEANPPVYYPDLQSAYDNAPSGGIIKAMVFPFHETLSCHRNIAVTLKGGYDEGYGSVVGMTTLRGELLLLNGRVVIEGFTIE
ncbi:MAG TPA: VCBS repeat-containing protein [Bdellovibrionota bacterium]|nr:VCBS repeat-containing protein [Bdellovibrionota bacterium]